MLSLELSNRLFLPAICMRNYMDEAKALNAGSTSRSLRNLTERHELNTVLKKKTTKRQLICIVEVKRGTYAETTGHLTAAITL